MLPKLLAITLAGRDGDVRSSKCRHARVLTRWYGWQDVPLPLTLPHKQSRVSHGLILPSRLYTPTASLEQ